MSEWSRVGRAAASGEEKFDLPEAIAWFGDILKYRRTARRDRAPFVLCQSGGRWQAGASGGGSAYDLTPLVTAWDAERGAGSVGRETGEQ